MFFKGSLVRSRTIHCALRESCLILKVGPREVS